jgi:hypothetical protein
MIQSDQEREICPGPVDITYLDHVSSTPVKAIYCTSVEEFSLSNSLCSSIELAVGQVANKSYISVVGGVEHEFAIWPK